jgi:glycine reductase
MRAYEKEGKFAKLHDYYYVTVGTGTTQGEASRMGREIAQDLRNSGVDAVILTAT